MIEKISEILKNVGLRNVPQDPTANLFFLGLDSLLLSLFILKIETEFQIKFNYEDIHASNFESINKIVSCLMEKFSIN